MFEGHFGDSLSNFLAPLNMLGTDEATHLKFGRLIGIASAKPGYFRHKRVRSFARSIGAS